MFDPQTHTLLNTAMSSRKLLMPMLVCQKSLRHDMDDLVALHFDKLKLAVVADANTEIALAAEVFRALKNRFDTTFIFLTPAPVADEVTAEYIRLQTKRCDALIAVGSGTINDLCKYASFADKKPYIVFPTAASMNGYLSTNASISFEGYKKTVPAHMPQAVLCDLGVIASAPLRLSKSGFGDSLARPTAQTDWLMSNFVLGTDYDETPFELLKAIEPILFDSARGIAKRDTKTIELLVHTLLLSGLGMTLASGSYPASQGEHMIAHTHEMLMARKPKADQPPPTLHGEEIAVTTLAMARLQQGTLRQAPPLRFKPFPANEMQALFGQEIAAEAASSYQAKADKIRLDTSIDWDALAARLEPVMLSPEVIHDVLQAAESPCLPEELGWNGNDYHHAMTHARFLRDRFTFLDLVP